jgi:hypothetical protein
MNKINLKNVTLIGISSIKMEQTIQAMKICEKYCNFYDKILFTDKDVDYKTEKIPPINCIKDYNRFVIKRLPIYIKSDFCLTVHWDGFIVNPSAWTNEFLNYDYIGAPWPQHNHLCGNGGFCLKSKKFLNIMKKHKQEIIVDSNEDLILCIKLRDLFEKEGCKYAPTSVAYKFSTEKGEYKTNLSFGFHDFKFNPEFKKMIN